MAGRTEENGIPCGLARCYMRRCIILAEVRLGLNNSSRQNSARRFPDQQFPQQRPRDTTRIAIEELGFQRGHATERSHVHQAIAHAELLWPPAGAELRSAWTGEAPVPTRASAHERDATSELPQAALFKYASTSSACPSAFTLLKTCLSLPSRPMAKVVRAMPFTFLPYMFFSLTTPNRLAIFFSGSASRGKGKLNLS